MGRISDCTPKVSVTTSDRDSTSEPTGSSIGMTYQSLPKPVSVSTSSICARSVAPGRSAPRSMRASSSSQNRGAGMPWKVTGAGITVRVTTSPGSSWPVPMLMSPLRSKEYQSSVAVGVLLRGQGALAEGVVAEPGREREGVLHPVRLPGLPVLGARARLAEERVAPGHPRAVGLDDLGPVARVDAAGRRRGAGSAGSPSAARSRRPSRARPATSSAYASVSGSRTARCSSVSVGHGVRRDEGGPTDRSAIVLQPEQTQEVQPVLDRAAQPVLGRRPAARPASRAARCRRRTGARRAGC